MSWFGNLLKGASKVAGSLLPGAGGVIANGVGSIIDSFQGDKDKSDARKYAERIAQMQIDAQREANEKNLAYQREANAANIALQDRINQSQIDFQREVNDLMRSDAHNQLSIKRSDLARAGYSSADPSLQGFAPAALGAPSLSAATVDPAHADSEFSPAMAANLIQGRTSYLDTAIKAAQARAQIDLESAQTVGANKDNALKDARNQAELANLLEQTDNLKKQGKLTDKQAQKVGKEIEIIGKQGELLSEQIAQAKFTSDHQKEAFEKDMERIGADIAAANSQSDLNKILKDIKEIEKGYAEKGISVNGTDMISALARLFASPAASLLRDQILSFFSFMWSSASGRLSTEITRGSDGINIRVHDREAELINALVDKGYSIEEASRIVKGR